MSKQQQIVQQEEPVNEKKVETLCKKALLQVTRIENRKATIIKKLAQQLEDEAHVPRSSISATITRNLQGYVSAQYISRCLNPEQKDNRKVRHNTGRKRKLDVKERTVGTHEGNGDGDNVTHEVQEHVKSGIINIKQLDDMYNKKEKNKSISSFMVFFNEKRQAQKFEEMFV